jgi:hypothetical protein
MRTSSLGLVAVALAACEPRVGAPLGSSGAGGPRASASAAPEARCAGCGGELALGAAHVCHLDGASGRVWCWGDNSSGQLGDGSTRSRSLPAPVVGVARAAHIAAADDASCALVADGEVWCWGGSPAWAVAQPTPRRVPELEATRALALSSRGLMAIDGAGKVHWRVAGRAVVLGRVVGVLRPAAVEVAALRGECFVRRDGSAACVGSDLAGALTLLEQDVADASRITATGTCALQRDGGVRCGGAARAMGGATAVDVAAGRLHACAVTAMGEIWCWGHNDHGALGFEPFLGSALPVDVLLPAP